MHSSTFFKASGSRRLFSVLVITAFLCIIGVGVVDYITGSEITFALLYMFPVAVIAWFSNKNNAIAASLLSAFTWLIVDYFSNRLDPDFWIYSWNYFSRLILLGIIVFLLRQLKNILLEKDKLSREDPLTKSLNLRAFREIAEIEISRAIRYGHTLSLAYIDVDNFKYINDIMGHETGNRVLCAIIDTIRENLRESDTVARVGGDEFVVLLPVIHQEAARIAIKKIHDALTRIMHKNDWPVTFSFGVLTCIENIPSIDRMIEAADQLMYSVKKNSKNGTNFMIYGGQDETDS